MAANNSSVCPCCSKPAMKQVTVRLRWLHLWEHRIYHKDEVCTLRVSDTDRKLLWAARETYRTAAREVAAGNGAIKAS